MTDERNEAPPIDRRGLFRRAIGLAGCVGLGAGVGSPVSADDRDPGSAGKPLDVAAAGLPYRQDDAAWARDLMWDRKLVIRADRELNGRSLEEAQELLREFEDGNTIGNEGCLLTSLAMVLRLLAPRDAAGWTPRTLNRAAQKHYFYTLSGLSMTALYADLVSELTEGDVQLALKEEYLAGVALWPRAYVSTSALVRAYRSLARAQRGDCLVLLKTGTYDDTVASHYLLLHPDCTDKLDDRDPEVLDPAKPIDAKGPWRLSDSARQITLDREIAAAWAKAKIEPTQIGGVWVFVRWRASHDGSLVAPLVRAWARELAAGKR